MEQFHFRRDGDIAPYRQLRLATNQPTSLEYELEMKLRHTYIDPKTGEHLYRPDDDVGEGLICVGSRDYTPVLKDE